MASSSVHWLSGRPFPIDHEGPTDRSYWPIDEAALGRAMLDRFEEVCARHSDRIAVDDGRVQLSYAALRSRAYDLAAELESRPQSLAPIAAVIPSTIVYPIALLAGLAVGRPLVPVDVTHPLQRKSAILTEAKPDLVIVQDGVDLEPELLDPALSQVVVSAEAGAASEPTLSGCWSRPDALAGVAFTSGSTGRAKGLAYGQRQIFSFVAEHVNSLHINAEDIILSLASLGAGGNLDILSALLTGARVRMLDLKSAGIGETLRVMQTERVTLLSMIPLVFRTLFQQEGAAAACSSLRAIITGGDRLMGGDLELFRSVLPHDCAIRVTQGATETGVVFNWFVPRNAAFEAQQTVPSGYIGLGKSIAVLPSAEGDASDGVLEGEFLVRGPALATGAWQDGKLAPGPFIADPEDATQKIYDTGDVVRRRADGLFEFVGRRDRQIKILGLRADPGEVEAILRKVAGVADVVVIPRRSEDRAVFVAFVVPLDFSAPPSASAIRAAVRAEAPPHMAPAEVQYLPAIPRLPNYKPDFVALEALDRLNRGPEISEEAPASSAVLEDPRVVRAVEAAWSAVLGPDAYRRGAPFDEAGGDSLRALQLMLHIEDGLQTKLPLELMARDLTPAALAARLAQHLSGETVEDDDRPLVILFPGVGGDEPKLADFRRELSADFRFAVVEYPGMEYTARQLGDLELHLQSALEQVRRIAPTGDLRLWGYSVGGMIAYELARRLSAEGRMVDQLVLLDTKPEVARDESWGFAQAPSVLRMLTARSGAGSRKLSDRIMDGVLSTLTRVRALELMRRLALARGRGGPHSGVYARHYFLARARGRAFLSWRAKSYDGELLSVVTAGAQTPPITWEELAPRARELTVSGNHWTMLTSPHLEELAGEIRKAALVPTA